MQRVYLNLFIVGAAKAGTTSLYECLSAYSKDFMSPLKELHYFTRMAQHAETMSFGLVMDEQAAAFLKYIYALELAALEKTLGYALSELQSSWDRQAEMMACCYG